MNETKQRVKKYYKRGKPYKCDDNNMSQSISLRRYVVEETFHRKFPKFFIVEDC